MSVFMSLFKRELHSLFLSPIAYVVTFFFWVITGLNFVWLLSQLASGESITLSSQLMFGGPLLTFVPPVVAPLITMRLFAEERRQGTLEGLLTTSVRVHELVFAKFAGALVFYLVLWLPVFAYVMFQKNLCPVDVAGFPDTGALLAGGLGVVLVGSLYISVGLLMSSLASNQIIAAIGGFALLFGLTLSFTILAYAAPNPSVRVVGQYFSSFAHMMDFSRGIVDGRVVAIYVTYVAWFLFATVKAVGSKRP